MNRMASLMLVATIVGITSSRADEPKVDLAKLQGSWTGKVGAGKNIPATLVVKDNAIQLVLARPDGQEMKLKGKLKLNELASPKTLDWTDFTNPQGEDVSPNLGVYKLDADTWTICSGGPGNDRPTTFEPGEAGPPSLTTWTRVKEKTADKPITGDLARFQGTWTGKAGEKQEILITLTIKVNEVAARWDRGDGTDLTLKGELRVNDQAKPKTVEFFHFKRSDGEETKDNLGIYEFDGETLKILTGGPGEERPTEFKATEGDPHYFVLTRKKD